jgi:hypothetical protein
MFGHKYLNIGSVLSGQQRDILLVTSVDDYNYRITLDIEADGETQEHIIENNSSSETSPALNSLSDISFLQNTDINTAYNLLRYNLIMIITDGIYNRSQAMKQLEDFVQTLDGLNIDDNLFKTRIANLRDNIVSSESEKGQIMKAFSNDEWFNRWGKHYLLYFTSALNRQICANFKDTALQEYGGNLFNPIRDSIEELFNEMEVPTPTGAAYDPTHTNMSSHNFANTFNNSTGPCICGDGLVDMADGSKKLVKDIVKGDRVQSDKGAATVECVLKTNAKRGKLMSTFNGMKVTAWHPIRFDRDDKWQFPTEVEESEMTKIDYVYDFVLDKHHIVNVNGIDVICLGHGFTDGILNHSYFGTSRIVNDLKSHKEGWEEGLIVI